MTRYPAGLMITALSFLGGCGNTTPDVTTLMAHGNCEGLVAGVSEIRFEDLAGIRGSQLLLLEDGITSAAPSPNPEDSRRYMACRGRSRRRRRERGADPDPCEDNHRRRPDSG